MATNSGRSGWGNMLRENQAKAEKLENDNLATEIASTIEKADEKAEKVVVEKVEEKKPEEKKAETSKKEPAKKKKAKSTPERKGQTLRNFYLQDSIYVYVEKILPLYKNNFSEYLRKLIVDDINANYKDYMEQVKNLNNATGNDGIFVSLDD